MNRLQRFLVICVGLGIAAAAWHYAGDHFRNQAVTGSPTASKTGSKHAEVGQLIKESDLNKVKLSPEAFTRLGIELHPVEVRTMTRSRPYGADLVLPTGAAVIVTTPLAGTLRHPSGGRFPQVGQQVRASECIMELVPLLTPERSVLTPAERIRFAEAKVTVAQAQIDADGQFQQATVQVEATRIALTRAERLLADGVGTRRTVDDARAQFELAEKSLAAAKGRKQLVDNIKLDEEAGTLVPLSIESPLDGIVRATHVQTGQLLAAGQPLFEVMNDAFLWIKVPIYVGELEGIDVSQPARLGLANVPEDQRPKRFWKDNLGKPIIFDGIDQSDYILHPDAYSSYDQYTGIDPKYPPTLGDRGPQGKQPLKPAPRQSFQFFFDNTYGAVRHKQYKFVFTTKDNWLGPSSQLTTPAVFKLDWAPGEQYDIMFNGAAPTVGTMKSSPR